jgi:RND family efflux transporter MFP subunit
MLKRTLPERVVMMALTCLALSSGIAVAQQTAAPPAVTVSRPLSREIIEWNEYTGQFQATEAVEVRARVSGYLTEIHFQDGQFVKKGDLLFVIDPRPYEIALAQAKAQVTQAEARLDLGNRELERAAELRKRDNIPASTYDQRAEEVKSAAGALQQARAAVQAAELDLEFAHLTSPMDGHVSRHMVSIGNLVFGGTSGTATLLTTIVATDPIFCVFDISEADLLAYQRAAASGAIAGEGGSLPVEGHLLDEKEWRLKGRLDFVENQLDRGSGTLRVRAVFPNPGSRILAGVFARVRVPASSPHQVLMVPDEAVVSDQSRKLLMVVAEDGTVSPRVVTLGPLEDGLRIVRDGIKPADRVVINGLMRVRPGAKVTAQDGKIAAQ